MNHSHAFKLALGALYTAGHDPSIAERLDLHSRCSIPTYLEPEAIPPKAIAELDAMGYKIARNPCGYRLLEPVRDLIPQDGPPSPGHGVKTYGSKLFKDGEITFIQGDIGEIRRGYRLTARAGITCLPPVGACTRHTFSVSCGGPSMDSRLNTKRFRRTDETTEVLVWRFAFTPEANSAVHFLLKAPVWTYDWSDEDRLSCNDHPIP